MSPSIVVLVVFSLIGVAPVVASGGVIFGSRLGRWLKARRASSATLPEKPAFERFLEQKEQELREDFLPIHQAWVVLRARGIQRVVVGIESGECVMTVGKTGLRFGKEEVAYTDCLSPAVVKECCLALLYGSPLLLVFDVKSQMPPAMPPTELEGAVSEAQKTGPEKAVIIEKAVTS